MALYTSKLYSDSADILDAAHAHAQTTPRAAGNTLGSLERCKSAIAL